MPLEVKCLALILDQGYLVPPPLVGACPLEPRPGNDSISLSIAWYSAGLSSAILLSKIVLFPFVKLKWKVAPLNLGISFLINHNLLTKMPLPLKKENGSLSWI